MARPTGTWLSGLGAAGVERGSTRYRGERLGLPEAGAGSAASFGRRLGGFVVDALLSALVASAFVQPPELWSYAPLAFAYVVLVPLVGQTPGMRLLGMRLTGLDGGPLPLPRALVRFLLLALLLPAVVSDSDGRGLHDKLARSLVVRS